VPLVHADPDESMTAFSEGSAIAVRYWRAHLLREARPCRVVEDNERGLLVWLAGGTTLKAVVTSDGSHPRRLSDQLAAAWHMTELSWLGDGVLQWFPPDRAAFSVWWFFDSSRFHGWYVNLEAPAERWSGGVDNSDHALDIVVAPDRSWAFKDEDEFAERIGHPWYWTAAEADGIRAEADRVIKLVEESRFPFDGTWCGFSAPADWTVPTLPDNWNEGRARPRPG
jgi:protein associated with RNAse G/E